MILKSHHILVRRYIHKQNSQIMWMIVMYKEYANVT